MFIRGTTTKNKKTNKNYIKHALVESFRTENGPRQRVIMQLGTLSLPKSQWRKLAAALEGRLAGQTTLFEEEPAIANAVDDAMARFDFSQKKTQSTSERHEKADYVSVDLQSVTTSESRSLGPELVGHSMWERLNLPSLLKGCGFSKTELALAETVVLGRLISPSSDLASWRWLRERTALVEMLPANLSKVGKDAVYEIADRLLAHKDTIEKGLRDQETTLFPRQNQVFLFDLTNTYFEGSANKNDLAKRGKSKEKRSDCALVTLALVVDDHGFPVSSHIYGGNQSEPETLQDILHTLNPEGDPTLFKTNQPMIVMDRGIATKDNMALLKAQNYPYIVIERRAVEKEYTEEFTKARESFERITGKETDSSFGPQGTEAVYVKKMPIDKGTRVLCLSEGRERKEMAMDQLKEERFLHDLTRVQASVQKGNIKVAEKVGERIGRLRERYPTIAGHYDMSLELDQDQRNATDVHWQKKETRNQRSVLTGCYVIETSDEGLSAPEIWRLYTTLTTVEAAFRSLKTDLGVRPVHHQLAERTKGHLFISVLAYHLLMCTEYELRQKGDHRRWSTVKEQLSTHQRNTVILTDEEEQIHHIRVSSKPEKAHKDLYKLLDVTDPLARNHRIIGRRL